MSEILYFVIRIYSCSKIWLTRLLWTNIRTTSKPCWWFYFQLFSTSRVGKGSYLFVIQCWLPSAGGVLQVTCFTIVSGGGCSCDLCPDLRTFKTFFEALSAVKITSWLLCYCWPHNTITHSWSCSAHCSCYSASWKMETKIFPVLLIDILQFFDSEPEQIVLMSSPDVTWTEKKI